MGAPTLARPVPLAACALCATVLLVAPRSARADRIDTLATSLLSDPSWRVKVQAAISLARLKAHDQRALSALIEALRDSNEGVRAVAADTLGKIGEPGALDALRGATFDSSAGVRAQAQKSISALEKVAASRPKTPVAAPARYFIELSEIAPGKADAEAAHKVHERAVRELENVGGVTLDPAATSPKTRLFVDGNIAGLSVSAPDANGRVHTDCSVRMVVATLPEKSIRMMATLESSVDGTPDPKDLAAAKNDCLVDAGKQIAEKVQSYLETHP